MSPRDKQRVFMNAVYLSVSDVNYSSCVFTPSAKDQYLTALQQTESNKQAASFTRSQGQNVQNCSEAHSQENLCSLVDRNCNGNIQRHFKMYDTCLRSKAGS